MKIYDFSGKKNISGDRIKEARKNMKLLGGGCRKTSGDGSIYRKR